jgi:hypothetical protein
LNLPSLFSSPLRPWETQVDPLLVRPLVSFDARLPKTCIIPERRVDLERLPRQRNFNANYQQKQQRKIQRHDEMKTQKQFDELPWKTSEFIAKVIR